jgi:hypothetical protein
MDMSDLKLISILIVALAYNLVCEYRSVDGNHVSGQQSYRISAVHISDLDLELSTKLVALFKARAHTLYSFLR